MGHHGSAGMAGLAMTGLTMYLNEKQKRKATKHAGMQGISVDQYLNNKYGNKAMAKGQSVATLMAYKQARKAKKGPKAHKKKKGKKGSSSSSSSSSSSDSD